MGAETREGADQTCARGRCSAVAVDDPPVARVGNRTGDYEDLVVLLGLDQGRLGRLLGPNHDDGLMRDVVH